MRAIKDELREMVDARRDALVELSHRVHAANEIRFEERRSSQMVADSLAGAGFRVEMGVCDLETAFVAASGSGPLTIGICAEYDALPGIGHACGHNVIAAAAAGQAWHWRALLTTSALRSASWARQPKRA